LTEKSQLTLNKNNSEHPVIEILFYYIKFELVACPLSCFKAFCQLLADI